MERLESLLSNHVLHDVENEEEEEEDEEAEHDAYGSVHRHIVRGTGRRDDRLWMWWLWMGYAK